MKGAGATSMKAIILSAGQGKRLSPLTDTRPKCLVELSGRSVLSWQLRHLASAGVTEAVVVTGFAADAVEAEIAGLDLPGIKVRTLFNPFFSVTDNLATCWMARAEMTGDFLILNGDTLFEPAIAASLLAAPPAAITVTINRKDGYDADDMKVRSEGLALRDIGKTIETYDAESIGFLRFDAVGGALFEGVNWLFGTWLGQLVLFGFTWVLFHHMLGGIRHFVWDLAKAMDPAGRELAVRLQLGAAVLLTLAAWSIFVWFK